MKLFFVGVPFRCLPSMLQLVGNHLQEQPIDQPRQNHTGGYIRKCRLPRRGSWFCGHSFPPQCLSLRRSRCVPRHRDLLGPRWETQHRGGTMSSASHTTAVGNGVLSKRVNSNSEYYLWLPKKAERRSEVRLGDWGWRHSGCV